ncbi:MAG: hypothetical protein ABJH98_19720 [Reichenbachiella sp.]|uniref:hypothetical protein n=1 Tax=Reichenbachiella sp. TaxID=2184521 RepID=UPI0032992D1B
MNTFSTLKKLALDMVPVFLAVFLAYQVNEYRDYRKEQENLKEAIKNIRLELLENKKEADTCAHYHMLMIQRLKMIKNKYDSGKMEPYQNFIYFLADISQEKRNLVLPRLSEISFETAKRKHAVSSMDYNTVNKISSVYMNMEDGVKSTQKLLLQSVSDPDIVALKDFERAYSMLGGFIHELYSQEKYLSKQIELTLEHLDENFPAND